MLRLTSWALNLIYAALLCAAAPWILWSAFRHGKYRRGTAAKLLGRAPRRDRSAPCLWFHAVSVGEVNLLATVIEEWQHRHPEWEIVISTTTDAAQALAAKKYPQFRVFYAPLDFSWAVANALRRIRPTVLVLAELEVHFAEHFRFGRLGDRSFRGYRRLRLAMAVVLRRLQLVAAQDEASATRFRQLGASGSCLHVTGSIKFDGAATDSKHPRVLALRRLLRLPATATIWIVGSTQAPEEAAVIDIFRQLQDRYPHLHLLIVPRHPHRFNEVADLLAAARKLSNRPLATTARTARAVATFLMRRGPSSECGSSTAWASCGHGGEWPISPRSAVALAIAAVKT